MRVPLDGFGSKDLPRTRRRRLHRKRIVVDGGLAFVGGINIVDDLDTPGHTPPRFDYAVAVQAPLLAHIHLVVRRLWALVTWTHFRQRLGRSSALVSAAVCGDKRAAFVVRDNLRHRRAIEDAYLDAIAAAQSGIIIANAYFLPGVNFRHALMEAAARGVRVTLLLQGRVEYLLRSREATMGVLGEIECMVGTGERGIQIAQEGIDGPKLLQLHAGGATTGDGALMRGTRCRDRLETPQSIGNRMSRCTQRLLRPLANASLVNSNLAKQANSGWPASVVCTAAMKGTLFSEPRPLLPPCNSRPSTHRRSQRGRRVGATLRAHS